MLTEHEMLYGLIATLPTDVIFLLAVHRAPEVSEVYWSRIVALWLTAFTAAAIVGHFL